MHTQGTTDLDNEAVSRFENSPQNGRLVGLFIADEEDDVLEVRASSHHAADALLPESSSSTLH